MVIRHGFALGAVGPGDLVTGHTGGREADYGDLDRGRGAGGQALVVAGQPGVADQPASRLLCRPAAGRHRKALDVVAAGDGLS